MEKTYTTKQGDAWDAIAFRVYGDVFVHEVGMSQNGAHSMAKAGKTYKDILDFFYHGAEIRTE